VPENEPALSFVDLMNRVRAGDEQAAAQLIADYEPQIRRVIRVRLTDSRLRRQFDSMDVCQSVMANFFVRSALGQFDLHSPAQLVKLLATMAERRLINHVHKQQAQKRDVRRQQTGDGEELDFLDHGPTASRIVAGRDLLEQVRSRLTPAESLIADRRAEGQSWQEIAEELGDKPDAVRMRFSRATKRIMESLGIESLDNL
jgi:RNA polymerase sigma-70 factor (ECF subfamily)